MLTSNALIHLIAFCCFSSTQGLEEILRNITASTQDVGSVIDHLAAENDTKSQEFAAILNYFVNLTVFEKEVRNEVARLTTTNFTNDDGGKNIYGSLDWQCAITDALNEENITAEFNETLKADVVTHIEHFLSKRKDLKDHKPITRRYKDGDIVTTNSSAEVFGYGEKSKEMNEFWDVTETRRIYGGNRTKIKFFPFMASVQIFERFSCAGSIIKSDLVITAASCLQLAWNNRFFRENPAFLSVRVGTHFFTVGGEVIPVMEVYFHPTYVPRTLVNNLAVMRLERNLKFKHRNVKKIDFDRRASALPVNTPGITIVGWGAKTHANKIYNAMANKIHIAVLDFYDLESCREIYGKKFVTKTNFCAGFITKGVGACNLDVGDPGISGRILVGVVSFGSPICGRRDTPTVFTKLGYYADWIEDIMEQDVPRIKSRTTTHRPSTLHKIIKLFEEESDESPISPLREGTNSSKDLETGAAEDGLSNIILNESFTEEPGIQPIIEAEPQDFESEVTKDIQSSQESVEDKATMESPQNENNVEKEWSDTKEDDSDASMNANTRGTKMIDFGSNESTSSETDETEEENVAKTSTAPAYNKDAQSELSDGAAATVKMVTSMGNADPEDQSLVKATTTPLEKDIKQAKGMDNKGNLESKGDTALRQKHRTPTTTCDDNAAQSQIEESYSPKKKHKKTKTKKKNELKKKTHGTPPISDNDHDDDDDDDDHNDDDIVDDADDDLIEFGTVDRKQDDVLENDNNTSQTGDIQLHGKHETETQPEMTEELIEREIEKLLTQLDFSNEQSTITSHRKIPAKTQSQNTKALKTDIDKANNDDSVWTLLYISDSEKKMKPRASPDTEDHEGLSIDPGPFLQIPQPTVHKNKNMYSLIGKSEIYEIFAEVMKAVVNKTSH